MISTRKIFHRKDKYSRPIDNLKKLGNLKKGRIYQIVAKFNENLKNVLNIVLALLLQKNSKNKNFQDLLLSENLEKAGISLKFQKGWFYLTILVAKNFECTIEECIKK